MPTTDNSQGNRDNYFLLLGLDPSENDWGVIKTHLQASKRKWSTLSVQGNSEQQKTSKANLKLVRDIERVMSDPAERAREAQEARRELQQSRQEAVDQLNHLIGVLQLKGSCSPSHVNKIVKDLNGLLSEAEIKDALVVAGIALTESHGAGGSEPSQGFPRLEGTLQRTIRSNLDRLGLGDLYEFLERDHQSPLEVLRKQADQINKEILRSGSTDLRSSARKELAGVAMSLFRAEEGRVKYNNTLEAEKLLQFHGLFDTAGHDRVIEQQAFQHLLDRSVSVGVNEAFATAYIKEYAQARKWVVAVGSSAPANKPRSIRMCPFCGALARSAETRICNECHEPLVFQCPRCDTENMARSERCVKCAFEFSNLPYLRERIRKIRSMADEGDLQTARDQCDEILAEVPGFPEAKDLDRVLRKKTKEQESVRKQLEKEKRALEKLIGSQYWDKARSQLAQLKQRLEPDDYVRYQQQLDHGIADSIKKNLNGYIRSRTWDEAKDHLTRSRARMTLEDYNECQRLIQGGIAKSIDERMESQEWEAAQRELERYRSDLGERTYTAYANTIAEGMTRKVKVEIDSLVQERRLCAAKTLLEEHQQDFIRKDYVALLQNIERDIAKSSELLKHRPEQTLLGELEDAWRICKDNPDLVPHFEQLHPPCPRTVKVDEDQADQAIALIRWEPAKWEPSPKFIEGFRYIVIRSENNPPRQPEEGMKIATLGVQETKYSDPTIASGIRYYYGVFAEADYPLDTQVRSTECQFSEQVFFKADAVSKVSYIPDDQSVTLVWAKAANSEKTWVFDYEVENGKLKKGKENIEKVVHGSQCKISGLVNGRTYQLMLIAIYRGQKPGKELRKNPVETIDAIPEAVPPAIELIGRYESPSVWIQYMPIEGVDAFIYGGKGAIPEQIRDGGSRDLESGDASIRNLACFVGLEHEQADSVWVSGQVDVASDGDQLYWFVAVTQGIKLINIGEPIQILALDEVREVRVTPKSDTPGVADLSWEWPNGVQSVDIECTTWTAQALEEKVDDQKVETPCMTVDRGGNILKSLGKKVKDLFRWQSEEKKEEVDTGRCELSNLGEEVTTITVYSKSRHGDHRSVGVSVSAYTGQRTIIQYGVYKPWLSDEIRIRLKILKGKVDVVIRQCEVWCHQERFPQQAGDGFKVKSLYGVSTTDILDITMPHNFSGKAYFAVFARDDALSDIRLVPERGVAPIKIS